MTRLEAKMTPSRRRSTGAHPTRLDLTAACRLESTSNDLRRSEVAMNLRKRCTYRGYYKLSFYEVFHSFGGRLLLLSFLEESSYTQLKTVCFVTVFGALYSYSVRRLWQRCRPSVCRFVTDVLWLTVRASRFIGKLLH